MSCILTAAFNIVDTLQIERMGCAWYAMDQWIFVLQVSLQPVIKSQHITSIAIGFALTVFKI